MARVTVEDCLKNVKNRFELVIVAAKRARQLMRGKPPKVEWDNDKPTVVALREIAAGLTTVNSLNIPEPQETIEIAVTTIKTIEIDDISQDEQDDEKNHTDEALDQPATSDQSTTSTGNEQNNQ